MSAENSEVDETFLRDDLHRLAQHTQTSNFNIRQFQLSRKDIRTQAIKNKLSEKSKNRVNTQPVETNVSKLSMTCVDSALERIMVKVQPDFKKRAGATASVKFSDKKSKSYSKSKMETSPDFEQEIKTRYKDTQKKINKGPLTRKILETWLNTILTQTAMIDVVDETVKNAALKRFQIDENSLLSRGIKPDNVERIYRSLFVHSIGFNNSLRELVDGRVEAQKNIWKVFSNLLQYCAQGKFQTLVGMIEREKITKIDELREEIAKRQYIIEKNDQLNENRNVEIFKQIKTLKAENINLNNEKQILYEDYQKTEQAFNQQVALRLKFQNKINELFGVHRQLGTKHQRLYDDYKRKLMEWNSANQKNTQLTQLNWDLKMNVNDLSIQKQKLQQNAKYNSQYILTLKEEKIKFKEDCNLYKHQYDEERRMTKELHRRMTQSEIQLKNLAQIVLIKDKSWKETHSEYQLSLQQNNRLYQVISEQRKQVEELLFDKKQFNNKVLSLVADASFEKKKKQEFSALYYGADKKLTYAINRVKDFETENKVKQSLIESLQEDCKENYENIKKMHIKNQQLEEELHFLQNFKENLYPMIQQKDEEMSGIRAKLEEKSAQYEDIKTSFNQLQLRSKMNEEARQSQIQSLKGTIQKLISQREELQSGGNQKAKIIIQARKETQRYMKLFQDAQLNFKNEKFERTNLKASYDQSLSIIQTKNKTQKQLSIQISELKDQLNTYQNHKNRLQMALENQKYRKQRLFSEIAELKIAQALMKQRCAGSVHMLVFEDLAENYRILQDKLQSAKQHIRAKKEEYQSMQSGYKNEIRAMMKSNDDYLIKVKREKDKQIEQKDGELEYEKEKNERISGRLQQLEQVAQTYLKKIEERTTSERQKMYKDIIEQKSRSIEELLIKTGIVESNLEKVKEQLVNSEMQFCNDVQKLKQAYKKENQKLAEKINDLQFDVKFQKQLNDRLNSQIKQNQENFEVRLNDRIKDIQKEIEAKRVLNHRSRLDTESISQNEEPEMKKTKNNGKWKLAEKIEAKNPEIKKRNEITRKLKLTYSYYKG